MATSTLPPQTPQESDERHNTAQQLADLEFNSATMSASEKQRLNDIHKADQIEAAEAESARIVREKESNPMGFSPDEGRRRSSSNKNSLSFGSILKKGGPFGVFGGIIGMVIFALFNLLPLMPMHVYHAFLDKYDATQTTFTVRLNKVIAAKIVDKTTTGSCTIVQIRCRFSRPSNTMLKRMDTLGITAVDAKGDKITKTRLGFPNARPDHYIFDDGTGKSPIKVTSDKFVKTLLSNTKFRAAFHSANTIRLLPYSDSTFKSIIKLRFGLTTRDTAADKTTEKDVRDSYNNASIGEDTGAKDAKTDEAAKKVVQPIIEGEAGKEVTKLSAAGKADAIGLIAGATCVIADAPGIVTRAARAYELMEFVKAAEPIMVSINAAMAGDGNPVAMAAIGTMLTETDKNGKSALDSFAFKSTLHGDTTPPADENYEKYVPGGETNAAIGGVTTITDSDVKKGICAVATNPLTGVAINAALAPETLGIGTAINIAIGFLASTVLEVAGPPVISLILGSIPPSTYLQMMNMFFGDKVTTAVGVDKGNLVGSGWMHMFSQLANGGGNMALSPKQKVHFAEVTNQVNLAYAEEDRATHSPFDATNSNTMMGTFVTQLLPLYSNMGSLVSTMSSIGTIASSSFGNILGSKAYAASTNEEDYTHCKDPSLKDIGGHQVAAGYFCDIQYGIPAEYLDMDSQAIVDDLVAQKQVDEETGEPIDTAGDFVSGIAGAAGFTDLPIASLKKWMDLCTDGTSASALNCQITDKQTAEYALYTIDHRIQKDLDDEDTDPRADPDTSTVMDSGKVVLPAKGYNLGDGWGTRVCPVASGCAAFHTAQDFIPVSNSGVYAATDGVVIYADKSNQSNNIVQIKAPNGVVTNYWHEDGQDILVSKGDKVTAGQRIGTMGMRGRANGVHLHFEIDITDTTDPAIKKLTSYQKADIASFGTVRTYAKPSEWFALYGLKM